ncbi:MAG: ABC transporter permease [Actinomycetia bacterium]|nr:ABC transporter permease [Actinomycetes bacterium]
MIASAILFFAMRLAPGDPVLAMYGGQIGVTMEELDAARERLGYNDPLLVQYGGWLTDIVRGNLGNSVVNGLPVEQVIAEKIWPSVQLAVVALVLSVFIAVPGGVLAALRRGSLIDRFLTGFVSAGIAIPQFWLGILLVLVLAIQFQVFPASGYVSVTEGVGEWAMHIALPSLTLAITLAAPTMRFVRSSMLDVLSEQFVDVARAKGLSGRRVIWVHSLRNALLPALTIVGLQAGTLMGGAVLIEWVFAFPGLGWLLVNAVTSRDYPVLQAALLLFVTAFLLVNFLVEMLYRVLDPRLR